MKFSSGRFKIGSTHLWYEHGSQQYSWQGSSKVHPAYDRVYCSSQLNRFSVSFIYMLFHGSLNRGSCVHYGIVSPITGFFRISYFFLLGSDDCFALCKCRLGFWLKVANLPIGSAVLFTLVIVLLTFTIIYILSTLRYLFCLSILT